MIESKDDRKTSYCAQQVSALMEKQQHILSVLVKKTYTIGSNGKCTDAEEMLPLYDECMYYPDNDKLLQQDYDLYAFKPLTDIVIKGKARNRAATNKFLAGIQAGRFQTSIQVFGNRKAYLNAGKKLNLPILRSLQKSRCDMITHMVDAILKRRKRSYYPIRRSLNNYPWS